MILEDNKAAGEEGAGNYGTLPFSLCPLIMG
jgi:hypothetical protein